MLRLALCGLAMVAAMFAGPTLAGTERYDYDALGRLVRVIDEQGRVTEYVYDPAGNILRVIVSGAGSSVPPSVASITPGSVRRGETKAVVITGTGLTGARVSASDPGLEISALQSSASRITFTLTVLQTAGIGAQLFSIANAAGSATAQITVNPVLPVLGLTPAPVALVTNSAAREFTVTLSSADNIDHTVSVTSGDTAIATVTPASLEFLAGQTSKVMTITPLAVGNTTLQLAATGLATASIPVGIGPALLGPTVTATRPLSVHLRAAVGGAPPGNAMSASRTVSVHLPAVIGGVPPGNAMSVSGTVSVHMPVVVGGAPPGNAMSASGTVSVHLPAVVPGVPAGNAMSATQPASVSMP